MSQKSGVTAPLPGTSPEDVWFGPGDEWEEPPVFGQTASQRGSDRSQRQLRMSREAGVWAGFTGVAVGMHEALQFNSGVMGPQSKYVISALESMVGGDALGKSFRKLKVQVRQKTYGPQDVQKVTTAEVYVIDYKAVVVNVTGMSMGQFEAFVCLHVDVQVSNPMENALEFTKVKLAKGDVESGVKDMLGEECVAAFLFSLQEGTWWHAGYAVQVQRMLVEQQSRLLAKSLSLSLEDKFVASGKATSKEAKRVVECGTSGVNLRQGLGQGQYAAHCRDCFWRSVQHPGSASGTCVNCFPASKLAALCDSKSE